MYRHTCRYTMACYLYICILCYMQFIFTVDTILLRLYSFIINLNKLYKYNNWFKNKRKKSRLLKMISHLKINFDIKFFLLFFFFFFFFFFFLLFLNSSYKWNKVEFKRVPIKKSFFIRRWVDHPCFMNSTVNGWECNFPEI